MNVESTDALEASLERLRLRGAIFLRAEYSEPWSFDSPDGPTNAAMLYPGSERLILFHVVARGRCFIALDDGERHWADAGDVIVLPYGDQHTMGGVEPAERVSVIELLAPPPWAEMPVIRHGQGGERTDVVCGYLHSDDPLFDPRMRALPPVFVVRPDGVAGEWVGASIEYALAGGSDPVSVRVPELLLLEILRLHLANAPAVERGWIAALRDPVLAPALAQLHAEPSRKWTVPDLAAAAAVSRSVLDDRFRQVLGRSPIRYLTEWRMHLADDLLATSTASVATVAGRVGYDSEEAFSRAFKRARGVSPAIWRARRSADLR
jgi:AraC-like DNA-binding protein